MPSEDKRDEALKDTFPASDPPANSGITGPRRGAEKATQDETRPPPNKRNDEERPKGQPTSDRHATETAYHWEREPNTPKR